MHAVMIKGCGGCPFSREARAVTGVFCAHPKAPYGTHISDDEASSGRLPEACPLRRWSCLIQAAESVEVRAYHAGQVAYGEPGRFVVVAVEAQVTEERERGMRPCRCGPKEVCARCADSKLGSLACCDLHSAKEEG